MRAISSAVMAMTMMASSALGAAPASQGALTPGKPAGTRQAQLETGGVLLVAGIVAVAAVIAVIASTTQGNSTPSTSS